jgi:hypothetical protein
MGHKKEYKDYKTCAGWTEEEIEEMKVENPNGFEDEYWMVGLMFKDVHGKATLKEQVAIEIEGLLSYNNVTYIPKDEIFERAEKVIKMIKKASQLKG